MLGMEPTIRLGNYQMTLAQLSILFSLGEVMSDAAEEVKKLRHTILRIVMWLIIPAAFYLWVKMNVVEKAEARNDEIVQRALRASGRSP